MQSEWNAVGLVKVDALSLQASKNLEAWSDNAHLCQIANQATGEHRIMYAFADQCRDGHYLARFKKL